MQKAARPCSEFSPSQMSNNRVQKGVDTGWDQIYSLARSAKGERGGEEQKKEDKQAPSLSHTRATAAGREPDFSWRFCLCFSSSLSENQEVKTPNLDVYLKYIKILLIASSYTILH